MVGRFFGGLDGDVFVALSFLGDGWVVFYACICEKHQARFTTTFLSQVNIYVKKF